MGSSRLKHPLNTPVPHGCPMMAHTACSCSPMVQPWHWLLSHSFCPTAPPCWENPQDKGPHSLEHHGDNRGKAWFLLLPKSAPPSQIFLHFKCFAAQEFKNPGDTKPLHLNMLKQSILTFSIKPHFTSPQNVL